jgi:glycosyltransferase involved in cell wall biosynthesis
LNILFVHQNFPGQYKHLARRFAERGENRVVALTMAPPVDIPGVTVIRHAWNRAQTRPHLFMTDLDLQVQRGQSTAHAAKRLKAEGFTPDVVLAHPGWGEALFLKDVFPAAPLICFQEFFYRSKGSDINFDPEFPTSEELHHYLLRIRNANILLNLDAADANVSPTAWQKAQFPDVYQAKISLIHDGIDTKAVAPDPKAWVQLTRDGRRFRPGDEVVTFVNRNLEPYRGFHSFLRAAPLILARRPNAVLLVVGGDEVSYGPKAPNGGTWRSHYLQAVFGREGPPANLKFVGKLSYPFFINLLQVSAAHVYLTYPFVLSWSMLEAMSAGALVIGSNTPPVSEVIEEGRNGLLVDFFSPGDIADRVCEALERPDQFKSIREQARLSVIQRYDLDQVCLPQHAKMIEDMTGSNPLL